MRLQQVIVDYSCIILPDYLQRVARPVKKTLETLRRDVLTQLLYSRNVVP